MGLFNAFTAKKYAALLLSGFTSSILFFTGSIYYGLVGGIGFMMAGLLLSVVVGNLLLKNPFTQMLEGQGIMALNIDSTGIIRPFIMSVQTPYLRGKLDGKPIEDVFDRDAVMQLAVPVKSDEPAVFDKNGKLHITLTNDEYNAGRFALFHYPVVIYNAQIGSIITKDWLSDKESDVFSKHGILYLNRKVEELTTHVRDFGRYVVETLKPSGSIFANKWIWIIMAIAGFIMLVLFGPVILKTLQQFAGPAGDAFTAASVPTETVTPR